METSQTASTTDTKHSLMMDSKILGNDFVPICAGQASVLIFIVESLSIRYFMITGISTIFLSYFGVRIDYLCSPMPIHLYVSVLSTSMPNLLGQASTGPSETLTLTVRVVMTNLLGTVRKSSMYNFPVKLELGRPAHRKNE